MRVTIDGRACELRRSGTVLEGLREAGMEVPTLCHDDRLTPLGGCRLCLVRLAGASHPVAACSTPLAEGLQIETRTPELEEARRGQLAFLARDYPADAVRNSPDVPFHRLLLRYGVEPGGGATSPLPPDTSNPYIQIDLARCIDCFRCVRICDEVQGQFVWQIWGRGSDTHVVAGYGTAFADSPCVSCGACADSCPTGAIADRLPLAAGLPESWTRTTCPYCGVGCEMEVGVRADRIVQALPALDAPVNHGHLCVKGRYAFGFTDAPDRPTRPMLRGAAGWQEVSWEEAIAFAAGELKRILDRHGPGAVGMLGSARGTNEESYLTQKLARAVLGTNNVDCCARVCHAPSAAGLARVFGTGAATNSFADVERARTLLVVGANVTEAHPIVGARIRQAARRGANLIVIDPRRTEIAACADLHLAIRPGTNVPLLNAMACVILEEGLADEDFLARRVTGLDAYREAVRAWTPERAAALCGVDADLIRNAARLYAGRKPAMSLHGLGLTEHVQGTDGVIALADLALLTGNIGKPGAGVNPLRGQNNVQGSAHMGCDPARLTGYVPIDAARPLFEEVWGAPVPATKGLTLPEMMDAAEAGDLHALWSIGYDIYLTNPHEAATRRALERLDLLIVQDLFLDETARELAHVFFPACSTFERDGTFMNGERRVQRVRKAISPRGESLPDWEILVRMAAALGRADLFPYRSAAEIWDEVRRVWPAGAGLSWERLERGGLQWPCPTEDHPGTEILHTDRFPVGERAALVPVDFRPTPEETSESYPWLLTTGRVLSQFNAGTMTGRTPNRTFRPQDVLDVSTADAERLGIATGERVRLVSRYGETVLPVALGDQVPPGVLFTSFHSPEVFTNRVTGPHRDSVTGTPEYKVTAVRVEKL
jgi:formate dehydrogenase major subunit